MPLSDWLRPPRVLFLWLYALFGVSAFTVLWLGRTLIDREHDQREQSLRQDLEQRADQQVSSLRAYVAETSERVSALALQARAPVLPEGAAAILANASEVRAYPRGRLLYLPDALLSAESPTDVFRDAEALEYRGRKPGEAAEQYRKLATSSDAAVRGGALLRLARILVREGQKREALAAYERLALLRETIVAGAPAELVARHASLHLLDEEQRKSAASKLRADLASANWRLSRGQFAFFAGEFGADRESTLSEAMHDAYPIAAEDRSGRGQRSLEAAGQSWFLLWRTGSAGRAIYVAAASSLLPALRGYRVALHDLEGRRAVRVSADTGLPWTVAVAREPGNAAPDPPPPRLLFVLLAVMFAFPAFGTYFIARAIRREIETSRLQSDFVAAVSHEFRSPLTTIRSLAEMLRAGRAIEPNRPQYYDALVTESTRLQRLVETLLNFGRMESGRKRFQFDPVDAVAVVREIVMEFPSPGRRIDIVGEPRLRVWADREAIAVAVRNLLENAIRYSTPPAPVEVSVAMDRGLGLISVRDHGPGVEPSEREAIFQKFVRGSAAAKSNARGTGVGLAVVRHIAEAHHGKIQLESVLGQGSTFTLAIPLEVTHEPDTAGRG